MTEVAARTGITVRRALGLPALAGARLVAGAGGADRRIRSVNMMEVPDIAPFLKADELLVTTAFPIRDDSIALAALVPLLAERGLAALAIKPGRYVRLSTGMLAAADEFAFPVIELPPNASFNDILADVLGQILNEQALLLERSRAIHDRLTNVVLAGGSFVELIETLCELVGHPAALLDARGDVLASAGRPRAESERRHSRPVQVGTLRHGEVIVWALGELPEEALAAMDQAATIAALLITEARAVLSRQLRYRVALLHELVSGRPLNAGEVAARAAVFGWNLRVPRTAIIVDLERDGEQVPVAGLPLEEQVMSVVRAIAGAAVMAWALPSGFEVLAEDASIARRLEAEMTARRLTASIGVGTPRGVVELHQSHREAFEALELGRQLHRPGFTLAHEELGVYRLLHQVGRDELERYVQETLGALIEYDRAHGSALVETLDAWVRNGGNRAHTARQLFVHYNTLRYRLEQIQRVTGGVDRHPTSRLALELALHARRLLAARNAS